MFVYIMEMLYFCSRKRKNSMIQMNSYFYGFYFYFAENCEAETV